MNSSTSERSISLEGIRCLIPSQCYGTDENVALETRVRYWSNPKDWEDGSGNSLFKDCSNNARIPITGEDVEIKAGWNMVLDTITGVHPLVLINGRLTFEEKIVSSDPTKEIKLRAKHVFVRGNGELFAGSDAKRYNQHKGSIEMWGNRTSQYITKLMTIEAGDKAIVNTGKVKFYGEKVDNNMSRLTVLANVGDSTITIDKETGLSSWKVGHKIGLAPTSYSPEQAEIVTITSINKDTGAIGITPSLQYTYYGSADETKYSIHGVDLRCEVTHLSRSFKVTTAPVCEGDVTSTCDACGVCTPNCEPKDDRSWGFSILTTDTWFTGESEKQGHLVLDNIELAHGSQWDTQKATIRFKNVN